jgi:hypothetical protein
MQTAFARFCAAPLTNSSSGSAFLHADCAVQAWGLSKAVTVMWRVLT